MRCLEFFLVGLLQKTLSHRIKKSWWGILMSVWYFEAVKKKAVMLLLLQVNEQLLREERRLGFHHGTLPCLCNLPFSNSLYCAHYFLFYMKFGALAGPML